MSPRAAVTLLGENTAPVTAQVFFGLARLRAATGTDAPAGATGGSGTCFGGSGRPALRTSAAGIQYLVGDISWGTKYCNGTSPAYRLDQQSARSFLGRFVALP